MKRIRAAVSVILCLLMLTTVGAAPLTGYSLSADDGEFSVDGKTVSGFDAAMTASADSGAPAVLLSDLTLTDEHTIPAGAVLQIPYDDEMTYCVEAPALVDGDPDKTAPFRTLRLSAGAVLKVDGALALSGSLTGAKSGQPCAATGSFGCLELSQGSELDIASGGSLYAWGRVSGEGTVNVSDGAYAAETVQFDGYISYSAFIRALNETESVFSLSKYRVDNIRSRMNIQSNAVEEVYAYIEKPGGGYHKTVCGLAGGKGFFDPADGTVITKSYDPDLGKASVEISGDVSIDRLSISPGGSRIDVSKTVFPLCDTDLTVRSGELRSALSLMMLPGSSLTVASGASVVMDGGLYAADADSWRDDSYREGDFAVIDVNGKLTLGSSFGTTSVGVTSSQGRGSVCFNSDKAGSVKRAAVSGSSYSFTDIAVSSPALLNASGTSLSTSGHKAGVCYKARSGEWVKAYVITLILEGGESSAVAYAAPGEMPAPPVPGTYRDDFFKYTFRKWSPDLTPASGDATYTALYYRSLRLDDGVKTRRRGDADADAEVTILDATHIQRYLAGLDDDPCGIIEILGDADMDGELSILDATAIQRYLVGFENTTKINKLVVWSEPRDPSDPPVQPPATEPQAQPTQPSETGTHQSPTTNYELPVL